MKKTVTINLNSFIFNIDEDAYHMLNIYLEKLSEHFSKSEGGQEIIKDIEARIAELFGEKISGSKQVIDIKDVEEVISILGYVDDIINSDDESEADKKKDNAKYARKLYRDSDSKVIAGVCSGLAAYAGMSVIAVRIIFLLLLFFGNVSLIAYLVLWIAVPEAKTTAQKLEMKGEKVNLENIEKTVKEEFDSLKKNFKNWDSKKFSDIIEKIGSALVSAFKILFKVFTPVVGVIFLIIGLFFSLALLVGFFGVGSDNLFYSEGLISFVWLPGILEFITESSLAWMLSISVFVFFVIPLIALIYGGILMLFKLKGNKYLSVSLFVFWIISIVTSVSLSINVAHGFRSLSSNSISYEIQPDSTNTFYFSLLDNDPDFDKRDFFITDEYGNKNIQINSVNDFHLFIENYLLKLDEGIIKATPSIDFKAKNVGQAEIEFRYYARGRTKQESIDNLELVTYKYNISDSIIEFPPYFHINSRRWSAQDLRVLISLPYESKVYIDKDLANLISDSQIYGKSPKGELAGKFLIVTEDGLKPLE